MASSSSWIVAALLLVLVPRATALALPSSGITAELDDGVHSIGNLLIAVSYETEDRLHLLITDAARSRWEVPRDLIPRQDAGTGQSSSNPKLRLVFTANPFSFVVSRVSGGEVLFDAQGLTFDEQYMELSTSVPSNASLYGLGESTRSAGFRLRNSSTYTLWTADTAASSTDVNLYGAYPFYVDVRNNGATHGVLLLNSNGMDVDFNGDRLTYKVIGGAFEFYFFAGPSPLEVVQQYTDVVGKPAPMPYWSLGYHQCRWGYKNVSVLRAVVEGYRKAKLPLEVMWVDIDYMDAYKDFTLDPVNFPQADLRGFVDQLHSDGQRFVLIVDPGIKPESNYSTYERAMALNIFINDSSTGRPYLGQVWPGPVHFPDFLHPKTPDFWSEEIRIFHDLVGFEGLWIDMNEASNFCTGTNCSLPSTATCSSTTCCLTCYNDTLSNWEWPSYRINNGGSRNQLGMKAIPTSATHYGGILEYNVHNLYGFAEAKITYNALKSALGNKRPFILSRSSFVGGGSVAAHWTGDNAATWNDLKYSIVGILNSGLFGIPMVGADICGFADDTTEELCNRWIQLGAFYPFSRNHNVRTSVSQELYLWDSVTRSAAKALGLRYQLLPYLYTLHYKAHTTGSPVARPVFFSFPGDETALGIDEQFLLGDGIMVSPVLRNNTTSVSAYFPAGTWYNLFDFSKIVSSGSYLRLEAALDSINVHVHQGSVVPMQRLGSTTSEVRKSPFTLLVAFGEGSDKNATGEVFLDDGERPTMQVEAGLSTFITFRATADGPVKVTSSVIHGEFAKQESFILDRLVILGVHSQVQDLKINGRAATSNVTTVVSETGVEISGLQIPLHTDFNISFEQGSHLYYVDSFSRAEKL